MTPLVLANGDTIQLYVSILPDKYFVERIGGDQVEVSALVGKGQSPETFTPNPKQMMALQSAKVYFCTGIPFEEILKDRIKSINPTMIWVDLRTGLELLKIEDTSIIHEDGIEHEHHHHGVKDLHIWLDPIRAVKQVQTISDSLHSLDGIDQEKIKKNTSSLIEDLQKIHTEIDTIFSSKSKNVFALFHPSWGYFADRYGLKQAAIEMGGKEPSAKQLGKLISFIQEHKITTIFVQEQMSTRLAQTIANQTGGTVVTLDPLSEDYIDNLRISAQKIAKALQ
jgi:zinc transport system substrate-binding protein